MSTAALFILAKSWKQPQWPFNKSMFLQLKTKCITTQTSGLPSTAQVLRTQNLKARPTK